MNFEEVTEFLRAGNEEISRRKTVLQNEVSQKLKLLSLEAISEDITSQFESYPAFYRGTYHYLGDPITFTHRIYYNVVVTNESMIIRHEGTQIYDTKGEKIKELYSRLSAKLEEERDKMAF